MKRSIPLQLSTAALQRRSLQLRAAAMTVRLSSTSNLKSATNSASSTECSNNKVKPDSDARTSTENKNSPPKKSILQQDEELRQKMSGLSGEGGEAGVEYENGEAVSMKRSVKNNMFRYI